VTNEETIVVGLALEPERFEPPRGPWAHVSEIVVAVRDDRLGPIEARNGLSRQILERLSVVPSLEPDGGLPTRGRSRTNQPASREQRSTTRLGERMSIASPLGANCSTVRPKNSPTLGKPVCSD
jgi:hypothetical protein